MVLVFALAGRKKTRNVGRLLEINPEAAHGVVHAGENLHWRLVGIIPVKLLINFQDNFEFAVERGAVNMRQVEIGGGLSVNSQSVLVNDFVNGARRYVAGNKVAVFRIPLFEEVPAFRFGNAKRVTLVTLFLGDPDASAFAARRFRHEPEFIFAWDRSRVHLDKLAVGVIATLLIKRRLRRASADDGVGGFSKDGPNAAGRGDDGIRGKGP